MLPACGSAGGGCTGNVADYGAGATGGAASPAEGLRRFLAHPPPHISRTSGWRRTGSTGNSVTFTSDADRVVFLRVSDGTWVRSEYVACD